MERVTEETRNDRKWGQEEKRGVRKKRQGLESGMKLKRTGGGEVVKEDAGYQ